MTPFLKKSFVSILGAFVFLVSGCGQVKQDKQKYHSEIKVVVDKAERNAEYVGKLMNESSSESESVTKQIANLMIGIEALDKFDADLKTAKGELAKIATPKFDDFNLKTSTDKWFDTQIKGTADMKATFLELAGVLKGIADVQVQQEQAQKANEVEVSDERKTQLLKQLEALNIDKRFRDIETAMHNAKNEVLTNEEKFIMQNELKVTKFVVGNL